MRILWDFMGEFYGKPRTKIVEKEKMVEKVVIACLLGNNKFKGKTP